MNVTPFFSVISDFMGIFLYIVIAKCLLKMFLTGRAGRVSKGFCYRLVTKAFWTNEIPEYMIPEMQVRGEPFLCFVFCFSAIDAF